MSIRFPLSMMTAPSENEQSSASSAVPRIISATYTSKEFRELASFQRAKLDLSVTAISGTSASLSVDLQVQNQYTLGWASMTAPVSLVSGFTNVTTASSVSQVFELYDECYRVVYTVAGTSPSITFTCSATLNCEEPVF